MSPREIAHQIVLSHAPGPFKPMHHVLVNDIAEAILAEREACARIAGARADNALRIAHRWTPGHDGNDRTIAHWEARNREALDIAADIRARAASADTGER